MVLNPTPTPDSVDWRWQGSRQCLVWGIGGCLIWGHTLEAEPSAGVGARAP